MTLRPNPASDWVHFLILYLTFQTQALKQKYSISGIPALIVIRKSDGQLITKDGRGAVQGKGPLAVKDWN